MPVPFVPFTYPDPQSIAGLNNQMVYGENFQFATGLNHQIALGSNLQLCINPVAMLDDLNLPGCAPLTGLLGAGFGGNLQLTLGTNTTITWGRQFTIAMGPENITIDSDKTKPLTVVILSIIAVAVVVHSLAFGLTHDEDTRAGLVVAFQIIVDVCLATLVIGGMYLQDADKAFTGGLRTLFDAPDAAHSSKWWALPICILYFGICAAAVSPPIAAGQEEGHFNDETAPTPPPPSP
jgi:hypothetical protein